MGFKLEFQSSVTLMVKKSEYMSVKAILDQKAKIKFSRDSSLTFKYNILKNINFLFKTQSANSYQKFSIF